jgi:hypothetical protein
MLNHLPTTWSASFTIAILTAATWAQASRPTPPAPVPAQILSAKKVFISYMGTDGMAKRAFQREHQENKPYDEFYAAVNAWGRYELVNTPGDADLVYELGFTAPIINTGNPDAFGPQFNLSIVDARTHFRLWTLLAPVDGAFRKATWDKNFATGLANLMDDLKKLSAHAEGATNSESK